MGDWLFLCSIGPGPLDPSGAKTPVHFHPKGHTPGVTPVIGVMLMVWASPSSGVEILTPQCERTGSCGLWGETQMEPS